MVSKVWGLLSFLWVLFLVSKSVISEPFCAKESDVCKDLLKEKTYALKPGNFLKGNVAVPIPVGLEPTLIVSPTSVIVKGQNLTLYVGVESLIQFSYVGKPFEEKIKYSFLYSKFVAAAEDASADASGLEKELMKFLESDIEVEVDPETITIIAHVANGDTNPIIYHAIFKFQAKQSIPSHTYVLSNYVVNGAPIPTYQKDTQPIYGMLTELSSTELKFNFAFDGVNELTYQIKSTFENEKSKTYSVSYVKMENLVSASPLSENLSFDKKLKEVFSTTALIELSSVFITFNSKVKNSVLNFLAVEIDKLQPEKKDCSECLTDIDFIPSPQICSKCSCAEFCPYLTAPGQGSGGESVLQLVTWKDHTKLSIGVHFEMDDLNKIYLQNAELGGANELCYVFLKEDVKSIEPVKINDFSCFPDNKKPNNLKALLKQSSYFKLNQDKKSFSLLLEDKNNQVIKDSSAEISLVSMKFKTQSKLNAISSVSVKLHFNPEETSYTFKQKKLQELLTTGTSSFKFHQVGNKNVMHFVLADKDSKEIFSAISLVDPSTNKIKDVIEHKIVDSNIDEGVSNEIKEILFNDNVEIKISKEKIGFKQNLSNIVFNFDTQAYPVISKDWAVVLESLTFKNFAVFKIYALDSDTPKVIDTITLTFLKNEQYLAVKDVDVQNESSKLSDMMKNDKNLIAVVNALKTAVGIEIKPVKTSVKPKSTNLVKLIVYGGSSVVSLTFDLSNYNTTIQGKNPSLSSVIVGSISEFCNEAGQIIPLKEKLNINYLMLGSAVEIGFFLNGAHFYSYDIGSDFSTVKKMVKKSMIYSLHKSKSEAVSQLPSIKKMFDSLSGISMRYGNVVFKTKENKGIPMKVDKTLLNVLNPGKEGLNEINSFLGAEIIETNKNTVQLGCNITMFYKMRSNNSKWISISCGNENTYTLHVSVDSYGKIAFTNVQPKDNKYNFLNFLRKCTHVTFGLKSLKFECVDDLVLVTSDQIITNLNAPLKLEYFYAENYDTSSYKKKTKNFSERLLLSQNEAEHLVANQNHMLNQIKKTFKLLHAASGHNPVDFVGDLIPCLVDDKKECHKQQEYSAEFVNKILKHLAELPEFKTVDIFIPSVFDSLESSESKKNSLKNSKVSETQSINELGYNMNSVKKIFAHIGKFVGLDAIPYIKEKFPDLYHELSAETSNEMITVSFLIEVLKYLKSLPEFVELEFKLWLFEIETDDVLIDNVWKNEVEDGDIDKDLLNEFQYKKEYSLEFVKDLLQKIDSSPSFDPFKHVEKIKPNLPKLSNLSNKELTEKYLSTEELEEILSELDKTEELKGLGMPFWLPKDPYAPLDDVSTDVFLNLLSEEPIVKNGLGSNELLNIINSEDVSNTKDGNSKNPDLEPAKDSMFEASITEFLKSFDDKVKKIKNLFPWTEKNKPNEESLMHSKSNRMLGNNCVKCAKDKKNHENEHYYGHLNGNKKNFNQEKVSAGLSSGGLGSNLANDMVELSNSDTSASLGSNVIYHEKDKLHFRHHHYSRMLGVAELQNTVELFATYNPDVYQATYYVPTIMAFPTYLKAFECGNEKKCLTLYGHEYVYYYVIKHGGPDGKVYDVKLTGKTPSQNLNNQIVPSGIDEYLKNLLKTVTFVIKTNHGLKLILADEGSSGHKALHSYSKYQLIPSTIKSFGNQLHSYGDQYLVNLTVSQNHKGMAKIAVQGKKIHTFVINFQNKDGWVVNSKFLGELSPDYKLGYVNSQENYIVTILKEISQLSFEKDGTLQLFAFEPSSHKHKYSATLKKIDNPLDFTLYVDLGHKKLKPETYKDTDGLQFVSGEGIQIHIKQPYLGAIFVTYIGIAMKFTVFHEYQNHDGWVEFSTLVDLSIDKEKQMYTPTTLLVMDESLKDLLVEPQQISFEKDGQVQFKQDFSKKSVVFQ